MGQVCHQLHRLFNGLQVHGFPFDAERIPRNGIYVLFEDGETGHGTNRIVRIGTHTGDKQLRSRLSQHFVRENKDRSIFRKNVGRAILNRDSDSFLKHWDLDLTTSQAKRKYQEVVDFARQKQVERKVSEYIRGHFRFVVFSVGTKERRLDWESKIISTVSLCPDCQPSGTWLGQYSPKKKIQQSGLWNVNELFKRPLSEEEILELEETVLEKNMPNKAIQPTRYTRGRFLRWADEN